MGKLDWLAEGVGKVVGGGLSVVGEGISLFKSGSSEVFKKLEVITQDGLRQVKLMELKLEIKNQFAELGKRIYEIAKSKDTVDIASDKKVQSSIDSIKKSESEIEQIKAAQEQEAATKSSTTVKLKKSKSNMFSKQKKKAAKYALVKRKCITFKKETDHKKAFLPGKVQKKAILKIGKANKKTIAKVYTALGKMKASVFSKQKKSDIKQVLSKRKCSTFKKGANKQKTLFLGKVQRKIIVKNKATKKVS